MGDVSFEEETYRQPKALMPASGGFASLAVRMGLAKDEKEARMLLVWVVGAGCIFTIGLLAMTFMSRPSGLDEKDIERIIQLQQR